MTVRHNLTRLATLVGLLLGLAGGMSSVAQATDIDTITGTGKPASLAVPAADAPTTTAAGWTWGSLPYNSGYAACPAWKFCIWTGPNATGYGRVYGGTPSCGEVANWQRTRFENNVASIKNNTSMKLNVLNRISAEFYETLWVSKRGNWGNLSIGRYADAIDHYPCL